MSSGPKWFAARAQVAAERVVGALAPHCDRIQVAGSLRRGEAQVGDIEIVCSPKIAADLFGEPMGECQLTRALVDLERDRRVRWRAETFPPPKDPKAPRKFYPLVVLPEGIPLDVFAVRAPAQWGAILAIRTGPSDFSRRLVTDCQKRGLRCTEGRLVRIEGGATVPTPTEVDFLRECGWRWVEPKDRR